MNTGGLILIITALLMATLAFIWVGIKLNQKGGVAEKSGLDPVLQNAARKDVEHVFDDEFREELRNRGRLHFEKVIGENAMFLQQDLRQTTSQLNEYMRTEIARTLQEEFKQYEQSIADAKQLAVDSIEKTTAAIDQQRNVMESQVKAQAEAEKQVIVSRFEREMARIVNHYIARSIGNQIDLGDQLDYILSELESNKAAIIEDVKRGT